MSDEYKARVKHGITVMETTSLAYLRGNRVILNAKIK